MLGGIAQPATLTALQAQLRRRGKRIGSVHGRLELLALRGRVSKTWLLGEIAWAIVPPVTRNERSAAARDAGVSARRVGGPSPPKVRTLAGAWGSGNGPATRAGQNPKGRRR